MVRWSCVSIAVFYLMMLILKIQCRTYKDQKKGNEKREKEKVRQLIEPRPPHEGLNFDAFLQSGLPNGMVQGPLINPLLKQRDFYNGMFPGPILENGQQPLDSQQGSFVQKPQASLQGDFVQNPMPIRMPPPGNPPNAFMMQGSPLSYNMLEKELNAAQMRQDLQGRNQMSRFLSQYPALRRLESNELLSQIDELSKAMVARNAATIGSMNQERLQGPATGYYNKLMQDPLVGPDGMTKAVLSDIMFGSLKQLASPMDSGNTNSAFLSNRQSSKGVMGDLSNTSPNSLFGPMGNEGNVGGKAVVLPLLSKINLNVEDQEMKKHHSRKHKTKKRKKKKNMSANTAAKVLLTLLVDKLKDIYYIDKLNASMKTPYKATDSETLGKIAHSSMNQNFTVNRNNIHRNGSKEKLENTDKALASVFATNLSFPLTVSDEKSTKLLIKDSDHETKAKDNFTDLDKSVTDLLSKLKADNASDNLFHPIKVVPAPVTKTKKSGLQTREFIDGKKSYTETESDPFDDGVSEFHAIQVDPEIVKSPEENGFHDDNIIETSTVPLDSPEPNSKSNDFNTLGPSAHAREGVHILSYSTGNIKPDSSSKEIRKIPPTLSVSTTQGKEIESELSLNSKNDNFEKVTSAVTSLPTSSLSSILNGPEPENSKASNRISDHSAVKHKRIHASIAGFLFTPTEPARSQARNISHKDPDAVTLTVSTTEKERTEYLQAARVLGAVFKKLKDTLAKKSVETAIKAMLKLIRSETSIKRGFVPLSPLNKFSKEPFKEVRNKLLNKKFSQKVPKTDLYPRNNFAPAHLENQKRLTKSNLLKLLTMQNIDMHLRKRKHRNL